jgi:hypothetical protein
MPDTAPIDRPSAPLGAVGTPVAHPEDWRRPVAGRSATAERFRRTSDRAFLGLVAEIARSSRAA